MQTISKIIAKGIYDYTGLQVVPTDNPNKRPEYPYFSYKITSSLLNTGESGAYEYSFVDSLNDKFKKDVLEKVTIQQKVVVSFNSYSNNLMDSLQNALEAWDWFKLSGRHTLALDNIVVVNIGNIQDRTIVIVDNYEYRQGFDVELRVTREIENRLETIEDYKIKGEFR